MTISLVEGSASIYTPAPLIPQAAGEPLRNRHLQHVSPLFTDGRLATEEYALTALLVLFAAPLGEDVNYSAVILPLAVLVDRLVYDVRSWWWTGLAVAVCAYFAIPDVDTILWNGDGHVLSLLESGAFLHGLVLAGGLLARRRVDLQPAPRTLG